MLRAAGVPATITEFLALLEALSRGLIVPTASSEAAGGTIPFAGFDAKGTVPSGDMTEQFYFLSRAVLVKDERHYDRFDRVFAAHFRGAEAAFEALLAAELPANWLEKQFALALTDEEKARIESLGGWDALMETLRRRLEEQKARHQGGDRWIGTGGTSPFGNAGYNPEGVRIGGDGGNRRAVKVWDRRELANLDDSVELGTRNVKLALRRLRRVARQGAAETPDHDANIGST